MTDLLNPASYLGKYGRPDRPNEFIYECGACHAEFKHMAEPNTHLAIHKEARK